MKTSETDAYLTFAQFLIVAGSTLRVPLHKLWERPRRRFQHTDVYAEVLDDNVELLILHKVLFLYRVLKRQ